MDKIENVIVKCEYPIYKGKRINLLFFIIIMYWPASALACNAKYS